MADIDDWRAADEELLLIGEEGISNAALDGLNTLARNLRSALRDERLTDAEMNSLRTEWESALDATLLPAIETVYAEAYDAQMESLTAAASSEATANAQRYVQSVRNRLVGVADEVFKDIQRELAQGMAAGEDPDQLARRVDRVFKERGGNNWLGRASVIAQTETAAAMNAGRLQAATDFAEANDLSPDSITKVWITREDDRVREAHAAVHGDRRPLTEPFVVAKVKMMVPGDPSAPPELTIQCRCTCQFLISNRTASGGPMTTEVVEPEVEQTEPQTTQPWYGVLAPEGILSGDRRKFKEGSLRHRDLPLPIMYQDAQAMGHDGAIRAGNIQGIQRVDGQMRAWGMLDNVGEGGKEAARQIDAQMLRGISVDVDDATFGFETEDGQEIDSNDIETLLTLDEEPVMVITDGRISGATLCSIPAFQEAFVALGEPPEDWDVHSVAAEGQDEFSTYLVFETVSDKPWSDFKTSDYSDEQWYRACTLHKNGDSKAKSDNGLPIREPSGTLNRNGVHAAAARFNQVDAPAEAKSKAKSALRGAYKALGEEVPDVLAASRPIAVSAEHGLVASAGVLNDFADPLLPGPTPLTVRDGRVFGHLATWGTCHIGFAGQCVTPPKSAHGYAYFHTGEVLTADGASVAVGHITLGTGHADPALAARPAAAHYDNTGAVVADVAAGDDEYGIWISGRVRPHADEDSLRAAALSGDWRRIGGSMELVAALAVNVPGFPIPRTEAAMVAGAQTALVASGIVTQERLPSAGITLTLAQIEQAVQTAIRREQERVARVARADRVAASIQQDRASRAARAAALVEGAN